MIFSVYKRIYPFQPHHHLKSFFFFSFFLWITPPLFAHSQRLTSVEIQQCIQKIKYHKPQKKKFQKSQLQLMNHLKFLVHNQQTVVSILPIDYQALFFWVYSHRKTKNIDLQFLKNIIPILLKVNPPNDIFLQTLEELFTQVIAKQEGLVLLYQWFSKLYPMVVHTEFSIKTLINLSDLSWRLGIDEQCINWMQIFLQNDLSFGYSNVMFLYWYRLGYIFHQRADFLQAKKYYQFFWDSPARIGHTERLQVGQILIKYALYSLDYKQVLTYCKKLQEQKSSFNIDLSKDIAIYEYASTLGTDTLFQNFDCISLDPHTSANTWVDKFLKGICYHKDGEIKQAIGTFQSCVRNLPPNFATDFPVGFLPALSMVYLSLQQNLFQEAMSYADLILSSLRNQIKSDKNLAIRCLKFVNLIQNKAKFLCDPFLVGSLLIYSGNSLEGEKKYLECLDLDILSDSSIEEIFFYFAAQKKCDFTHPFFKKLSTKNIPSRNVYFQQIQCFFDGKKFDDGITLFKQMETHYPFSPHIYNYVGYFLAENSLMLDQAQEFISKALEYDTKNLSFWGSQLWVHYKKKSYDIAKSIWEEKILPLAPITDGTIYYHVGLVYESLGDSKKSREFWNLSLQMGDFPEKKQLQQKLSRN